MQWGENEVLRATIGPQGMQFDLNPTVFEAMMTRGMKFELGRAIVDFGLAVRDGKVKKVSDFSGILYDGAGKRITPIDGR